MMANVKDHQPPIRAIANGVGKQIIATKERAMSEN